MTLVYLAAAWLAGILAARAAGAPWLWGLALAIPAAAGAALARSRPAARLRFFCLLLFALGSLRLSLASLPPPDHHLIHYNDTGFVTIEGLISDAPDVRDSYVNLRVRAETAASGDGPPQAVSGSLLVQAPPGIDYRYGAPVRVRGVLRTPPDLEPFSYRDYLARRGIHSLIQYAQVEVTGPRRGSPVRAAMLDFRAEADRIIIRLLPEPHSALLSGILLGNQSRISTEVREDFNAVSATHIIVISGSNLVILAGLIQALARRITRKPGRVAAVTIAGVLVYSVFVGGDAAVIRAAFMTTLALAATALGRQTYGLVSLAFTAWLMSLINPFVLWDVSFQLSFLATLGLVLYVEPLQSLLAKGLATLLSREIGRQVAAAASDAFIVTLAAQITTTPIMAYTFERFSLLALPVNFLIVPVQTPLMALGGLSVLAALVFWPAGQLLAWSSWLFLAWTVAVVRAFARLPAASLEVGDMSPLAVWGMYGLLFGATCLLSGPAEQRKQQIARLRRAFSVKALSAGGLVGAALLAAAAWSQPDGRLHVTFMDGSEGAAALIETPSGRQILVDAGGSSRSLATALGDSLPFWDRRIDLLIITQPDSSHTSALSGAMLRYHFDALMTNGTGEGMVLPPVDALAAQGTVLVEARPGMRVRVDDDVTLEVVHAPEEPPADPSEPGDPIILLLTYGDTRFLLAGSADQAAEALLLHNHMIPAAAVLQVPSGGHRESSSPAFLEAVSPQAAIIQAQAGNRGNLPHPETLERIAAAGAVIYRTDQQGMIRVASDGRQVWVRSEAP